MASEPKKPIEEMLEAAAKARREAFGSDPKMPNPMRARLHDEIACLRSEEEEKPRWSWIHMFWPRLAVAAATATILVIGPMMWWRSSHPANGTMQLARVENGDQSTPLGVRTQNEATSPGDILSKGPAVTSAATPNVALNDNNPAKIEPAESPGPVTSSFDESKRLADTHTVEATPAEVMKGLVDKTASGASSERSTFLGGSARPAAAPPAPVRERAAAKATSQFLQRGIAQSFRNNVAVGPSANILNNFQVEQEGTAIRVVDADGSTYTGKIEPIEQERRDLGKDQQGGKQDLESNAPPSSAQSRFRASGYNVSLKKSLVFEGDYLAPAGTEQRQQFQYKADKQTDSNQSQQEVARIVGTARAHGEKPVQVDALEVATNMGPEPSRGAGKIGTKKP